MNMRLFLSALLTLCLQFAGAQAQTQARAQDARAAAHRAPTVTVSLTSSGVRLAALGEVKQTRLEVYDAAGATIFDSGFLAGNVRDWAAEGRGLADGAYTFVLTARDLAGRLSLKQGEVVLAGGRLSLALGGAEPAGEAEPSRETAAAGTGGEAGAATLTTHDGKAGALTATAGDLTLRTGDVLAGEDKERVRVTADGKVGIGTQRPEAALDVAGEVKAGEGFRFADGSKLSVDERGALTRTSAAGEKLPAFGAAAASANQLAKFADSSGNLTDSALFEAGGNLGVNTTTPEGTLHLQSPDTTVVKVVSTGSAQTGRAVFQMFRGASAQASGWDFGYNTDLGSENFVVRELTNGSSQTRLTLKKGSGFLGLGTSDPLRALQLGPDANALFTLEPSDASPNAGFIRFGDFSGWKLHFGRSRNGSGAPLNTGTTGVVMTIQDSGAVGIGTTSPQSALDVRGNIRLGFSGELRAASGVENLRIIRGVVDGAGNIIVGSGFTASRTGTGLYTITFSTAFSGPPAIMAAAEQDTQVRTINTAGVTNSSANLRTYFGTTLTDVAFHFIAVGAR